MLMRGIDLAVTFTNRRALLGLLDACHSLRGRTYK
jgi:hypothetical protein